MKKILLFFSVLLLLACTKESSDISNDFKEVPENSPSANDRLAFQNWEEFNQTLSVLSKLKTKEELLFWAQGKNHSTLLNDLDTTLQNYSSGLLTVLNKDAEFELGDNVIWFHNGNFYSISKSITDIDLFKSAPDSLSRVGWVKIRPYVQRSNKAWIYGLDARNQYPFSQYYRWPCGGSSIYGVGNRKYIHEVWVETYITQNMGTGDWHVLSYLRLRIKLEWKGTRWRPATEERHIKYNVSGNAWWGNPHAFYQDINLSGDDSCFTNNGSLSTEYNVELARVWFEDYGGEEDCWDLTLSGTIYQHVQGDYMFNAWWNGPTLWE